MSRDETIIIKEGKTSVYVQSAKDNKKGPGVRLHDTFYNPAMESSRDLSVVLTQWFVDKKGGDVSIVDGLAASGIRGVRLANEVEGCIHVTINDRDESAYKLIKKNIRYNKLGNASASKMDLNHLLSSQRYDMIDIDPFGSPAAFIDSAIRSIKHMGVISCTATDTATLCGVYPDVCLRRYSAKPYHSSVMQEIGLRILLGFIAREAAKHDKGIEPLLCYSTDYYLRLYVQVKKGRVYADETIRQVSTIKPDEIPCLRYEKNKTMDDVIGPLYLGTLVKEGLIREIRGILFNKELNTMVSLSRLLDLLEEEADTPLFYYTIESIASYLKVNPPRREHIFRYLTDKGYRVRRTHITPTGFKTDAPLNVIEEAFTRV